MQRPSRRALLGSLAGGIAATAGCLSLPSSNESTTPRVLDLDEDATRWAVQLDGPVTEPPSIADGTVLAATNREGFGEPEPGSDRTWTLAALDVGDGTTDWTHQLSAPGAGRPRAVADGVYLPTGFSSGMTGVDQRLVKVAGGARRWRSDPVTGFTDVLGVDDAGRAFVGTSDDAIGLTGQPLFAVDGDDGSRAWSVESGDAFRGRLLDAGLLVDLGSTAVELRDPADGAQVWRGSGGLMKDSGGEIPAVDGAVFCSRDADDGEAFTAVDLADGRERWRFDDAGEAPFVPTGAAVLPDVGTGHDGLVVGTEYDGVAFALAPRDGGVRWRFETDGDTRDGPVAAGDQVFLGDLTGGGVYAVDATDGSELWRADAGAPVGSLGVAGETLVVRGGKGTDRLVGLARDDGSVRWSLDAGEEGSLARLALGDGVVAVGSDSGVVRVLGPDDG